MGLIADICTAATAKLLAGEVEVWLPRVSARLCHWAVQKLPEAKQERYREEWEAHLDEVPGSVGKFLTSLGFLYAATKFDLHAQLKHARYLAEDWVLKVLASALRRMLSVGVWYELLKIRDKLPRKARAEILGELNKRFTDDLRTLAEQSRPIPNPAGWLIRRLLDGLRSDATPVEDGRLTVAQISTAQRHLGHLCDKVSCKGG